jgi:hypothetical protein
MCQRSASARIVHPGKSGGLPIAVVRSSQTLINVRQLVRVTAASSAARPSPIPGGVSFPRPHRIHVSGLHESRCVAPPPHPPPPAWPSLPPWTDQQSSCRRGILTALSKYHGRRRSQTANSSTPQGGRGGAVGERRTGWSRHSAPRSARFSSRQNFWAPPVLGTGVCHADAPRVIGRSSVRILADIAWLSAVGWVWF